MKEKSNNTGYFIFSLDTELGTGYFDKDDERKRIFSIDGSRERASISRILAMLEEYKIIATWAVVGHIFYEHCEECEICPILEWKGKYKSYEEAYKTSHPLWYGADVVDLLLNQKMKHEIAFHGYSHETFNTMSQEKAEIEIQEFIRVAGRKGIVAKSIVFPRNKVGHLDLFKKYGFLCYRGEEALPLITRNKYIVGKVAKSLDHILGISTPPIYELRDFVNKDMVNLISTQHLFGFNRNTDLMLDKWGVPNLRIRRITRAIKKAASHKKVAHIWAHPWEFRTEGDFSKLSNIFETVAEEVAAGRMKTISMIDMAHMVIQTYGG
jgi:peptidoglycan/xylan/chitin deacetylase (PgdA/CDA1 family)